MCRILNPAWSSFRRFGRARAGRRNQEQVYPPGKLEIARPWLARALADGSYRHWLALDGSGRVAGGGGVLLGPWPANPRDPCTERAVILNVYTEPEFRKRGIARQVMLTIVEWLKQRGFRGVNLHASAEGRPLYEKLGFEATNEMRLKF